jgi:Fic family protein
LNHNYPDSRILAHSFDPKFLNGLAFGSTGLAAIHRLGEARGRQALFSKQAREELESLRTAAVVESSESSNRIEGVTAPAERIEALVLHRSAPKNRSEQEIAGYRDALQLIHESHDHMDLTPNVILQLHGTMFRYLPGEGGKWKAADNEIVERTVDGKVTRIRFKPTPAVATPSAMDDLGDGYRNALLPGGAEPLVAIGLAILDFLCIHPFRDGNGRMARLLALLLLYQQGYEVGRYISLERIIEESRETYYESLERSSQGWHEGRHDPMPWVDYLWGVLVRAYGEFEERVETLVKGRGSKTEQVRAAVARRLGPFSISEIEKDCPGVSRDMIRVVLRNLKGARIVHVQGRGRGAKWLMGRKTETP